MSKVNDILGNERIITDEAITISLERYNQLIIKEAVAEIATFIIKGTCVDDLFHILANNGYSVQVSTTQGDTNTYRVDVMMNKKESEVK